MNDYFEYYYDYVVHILSQHTKVEGTFICRPGHAAELGHLRIQRPMRLPPEAGLHAQDGSQVRPLHRVHGRRHHCGHGQRQDHFWASSFLTSV
ncbi:hypothetical protein CEXT_714791 [Caerostris extrusa]|uniref:Uncharacterized protein n=1 Tax=Caerostris extrusa TaxID=172846 RepID=A0AAV4XQL7_CAEEX|nr:hypothetical protein CEXT_714791 [Caerostris extrusa]